MAKDKRFNVSMHMVITELKNGAEDEFFDSGKMVWADVPYDGMLMLEAVLIGALDVINDAGLIKVEEYVSPEAAGKIKEWKDKMRGKGADKEKRKVPA
jgi:hypothetical protein